MQNIYQALFIKSHFPLQLCIFLYLKSEEPHVILVERKQTGLVKKNSLPSVFEMWRKDVTLKRSQPFLFDENVEGQWNLVKSVKSIGN